jgi:hypothetical protein
MKLFKELTPLLMAIVVLLASHAGCSPLSEKETDPGAGMNGSFEIARNGLPVNWLIYSPNTVPEADFDILLDREDFREGSQSLKFVVRKCITRGGPYSPGFTNEFSDSGKYKGPGNYQVSFWVKSDGAEFVISAGGVSGEEGRMRTLMAGNDTDEGWRYNEFVVDVPEGMWLRLELNVLSPGEFSIDDVRIMKL